MEYLDKFSKIIKDSSVTINKCKQCGDVDERWIQGSLNGKKTISYYTIPDFKTRKPYKCSKCCEKAKEKKRFTKINYHNCEYCNTLFVHRYTKIRFCSKKCRLDHQANLRKKSYDLECEQCGKEFTNNIIRKYCSDECDKASNRVDPIKIKCKTCKTVFIGNKSTKYCSKKCSPHDNPELRKKLRPKKDHSNCMKCSIKIPPNRRVCDNCKVKPTKKERKVLTKTCPTCDCKFKTVYNYKIYCKKTHIPSVRELKRLRKRTKRKAKLKYESWKDIQQFIDTRPSEDHHLDHIIPLNHPDVCGLHNTCNFQWLTSEENMSKSNSFDGTPENDSWRD